MFSARSDGDYIGSKINSVVICNGAAEAQIDGAFGGKELVYSKSCLAVRFFGFQSKSDVNAPNYQNTIFPFDFHQWLPISVRCSMQRFDAPPARLQMCR